MMSDLKRQRWIAGSTVVLLFVLLFGHIAATQLRAQDTPPRTQYESFDLSTPEAAVRTFVDLFQRRDYAGAFLIFAPQTQSAWRRGISMFDFDALIQPDAGDELFDNIAIGFNHTQVEHSVDVTNYLFDSIMLFAEERDAFLIDLRGDVEILRQEDTTIEAYDDPEDGDDDETPLPAVDVIASVEGIQGEVSFRMVPTPSGRWQILQVIVPGGDEEVMPWSVVSES